MARKATIGPVVSGNPTNHPPIASPQRRAAKLARRIRMGGRSTLKAIRLMPAVWHSQEPRGPTGKGTTSMPLKTVFPFQTRFCRNRSKYNWLGFLDTYRTLCIDPPQEIRTIFEEVRAAHWLECTRPHGKHR